MGAYSARKRQLAGFKETLRRSRHAGTEHAANRLPDLESHDRIGIKNFIWVVGVCREEWEEVYP